MLSDNDNEIMTILYGPILYRNYNPLIHDPNTLANNNGLWKSILALSNYVLLDAPILGNRQLKDVEELLFTTGQKQLYTRFKAYQSKIQGNAFSSSPREYHQDDVDTGIHYLFTEVLNSIYERQILLCKPVLIRQGAWIGAGATILPGVSVGKYAIVGAESVVTKDVPDYTVVVGNPAKTVKKLDPKRF